MARERTAAVCGGGVFEVCQVDEYILTHGRAQGMTLF